MVETTTDADGNYTSPNLSTLTAPYLVHVIKAGPPAVELYSIGSAAGVVNIHPLTDLIIRTWYQVQGTDVVTAFNSATPPAPPTATELGVIKQVVKNLLVQFLGLIASVDSGSFDLISTPFIADSTGFDNFLDNINVNAASGVIAINAASGVAPDYRATLAVSGTSMTSTLEEDLNNDNTFSTVSTATNPITGITASPYVGVWQATAVSTSLGTTCGGSDPIGTIYTLAAFIVDANGNFTFMDPDFPGFIGGTGNIAANESFTLHSYGDSLVVAAGVGTGTCPGGDMVGVMSSVNAGAGTGTLGGQGLNLTLTRVTSFAGTWTLSYTITAATDATACGDAIASIGIPQGNSATTVDAQGNFTNVTENVTGTVTSGGVVSFTIPGSNVTTDCDYGGTVGIGTGNYASAYGTFKHNNNKVSGTWTLTRQ